MSRDEMQKFVDTHIDALPDPTESIPDVAKIEEGYKEGESAKTKLQSEVGSKEAVHQFVAADRAERTGGEAPSGSNGVPSPVNLVADNAPAEAPAVSQNEESTVDAAQARSGKVAKANKAILGGGLAATAATTVGEATKNPLPLGMGISSTTAGALLGVGQVSAAISFVLGGIQAILDVTATVKSALKYRSLSEIAEAAKTAGHDAQLVEAVVRAANQKFHKAITRALSFASSAISLGVGIALLVAGGLALLAAGPAGWGILGIVAAIGLGITVGKLIYGLVTGDSEFTRHGTASRLYTKGALGAHPVGEKALVTLGFVPADLKKSGAAKRNEFGDKHFEEAKRLSQQASQLEKEADYDESVADDDSDLAAQIGGSEYRASAAEKRKQAKELWAQAEVARAKAQGEEASYATRISNLFSMQALPETAEEQQRRERQKQVQELRESAHKFAKLANSQETEANELEQRAKNLYSPGSPLQKEKLADAAAKREKAKEFRAKADEFLGQAEWKDFAKPERNVVRLIFEKLAT
jgi:hypothetical protein